MATRSTWRLGLAAVVALAATPAARAEVAATGTFGIDISVSFPFSSGTFDGSITGFDAGPFSVGGTPVDLQGDVATMSLVNGMIPSINIPALAATFNFDAVDDGATANALGFHGAGVAICTDAITCVQGQGTFVADVSAITDPNGVLPAGYVYTFDGTVAVDPGPFDAAGVFGLNAFSQVAVPAGVASVVSSDPTTFFDSRQNTLRDFLIDLTFAEVTTPGTVSFLGKSAMTGALPANVTVDPDVSVFVDIVTGGGLAFTPPVDVCVAYDDVDTDGVVDGTSILVSQLRVLHALALGQNFQDVTTTAGGGQVCGQVGTLSPFVVAVGPVPSTTTTTSTSTTLLSSTSTSTTVVSTSSTSTSTTTTTLPTGSCADAFVCLEAVSGVPLCGAEALPTKLQKTVDKSFAKALALLTKVGDSTKVKKATKLVKKTRKQVEKVGKKAGKFVTKKKTPISSACNDQIQAVVAVLLAALDDGRYGVPFPSEGAAGGKCKSGRWMFADLGDRVFQPNSDDAVFHLADSSPVYVQGCRPPDSGGDDCEKVLDLRLAYDVATGTPSELACDGFTSIEYVESSSGVLQDRYWVASSCTVHVEGDAAHLTGTFEGILQPLSGQGGAPLTLTDGCFSSLPAQ